MFFDKPKQEYKQNKPPFRSTKAAFDKIKSPFCKNKTAFVFLYFQKLLLYQIVSNLQGLTII